MRFDACAADPAAPAAWRQLRRLARRAEGQQLELDLHMDRVAHLAAQIAQAYGCLPADVHHLRQAAALHDIGKVTLPARILNKPGGLTPDEFRVVQTHCRAGATLVLGPTALQHLAAEIALTHHERWDGHGYPHGSAGTTTPLSGRIVAVADVFDALTRERPYKPAWSGVDAAREIQILAGHHFDPAAVEAFRQVIATHPGILSGHW